MIEVENLRKEFSGFTAVDDVSFSVTPGEVLGFLGPNGAGKSTTMKMIAGFITPTSGRVTVMGKSVTRYPIACRKRIGYLPEGAPLYADMTPPDFLTFIARMRGVKKSYRDQAIQDAIAKLELESVVHKKIDELSKGFKRRVGIAQAILHDPDILILDEPTDGLDPNQKHQVRNLIRNLSTDKIVILSTHILEEVTAVCSRALVIANGALVADDTPAGLQSRSRYHQAVTLEFNGAFNSANVTSKLEQLGSVASAETASETSKRVTAFAVSANHARMRDEVAQLADREGWPVQSLFIETGRLEDVFRAITGGSHV